MIYAETISYITTIQRERYQNKNTQAAIRPTHYILFVMEQPTCELELQDRTSNDFVYEL